MEPTTKKGLHNKSKPIQKAVTVSSKMNKGVSTKKYDTHLEVKPKILGDLLTEVVQYLLNNQVGSSCDELLDFNLNKLIAQVPKDVYNKMLGKILKTHVTNFVNDTKTLTSWRKKIKSWSQSTEKPETRGHPVVPPHKLDIFKKRALKALDALPFRSFPLIQDKFVTILEEFHYEEHNGLNYKPFDSKTCSKHWWFDFMKKNLDLKGAWESIPLEKTVKAGKASPRNANSPNSVSTGRDLSQVSKDGGDSNFTSILSSPVIEYEQPELSPEEISEKLEIMAETERAERMEEEIMMNPTEAILLSDDTMNAFDNMI